MSKQHDTADHDSPAFFPAGVKREGYTFVHATRSAYLRALLSHSPDWIAGSMLNPSASMLRKPSTIALHRIALRRLGIAK